MKAYCVDKTEQTPKVVLDCEKNMFLIKGTSIPKKGEPFYAPVIEWFQENEKNLNKSFVIEFDLDFFNIQSSRKILRLLYKLEELFERGYDISVKWNYDIEKDHMHEAGKDYSYMVNLPFQYHLRSFESENKELVNF